LVLYLHGSDGCGTDNRTHVERSRFFLLFASSANQRKQPYFLLAPQTAGGWDSVADRVIELLTDLESRYSLDPDRIYVTGISLGGLGTTDLRTP
jgi:predicted peptidase